MKIFHHIDKIAVQRVLSIVLVALFSFGGSWLWALYRGMPVPYDVDEASYLLAGDTFAHGRVTNLPHPMWKFFEAFQILQHPTYMSKYPPGQGIFLAAGQVMFGHPVYGVWLSAGLMCAAICWMLYAWISPRWAFIGGLVAVLQFGICTYWSQSYWGGAVAAMGGALVFGALPRIFKMQRMRDAFWLGVGCAVLVNSRPLEGFLVALPVACLVLPWKGGDRLQILLKKRVAVPIFIVLFITLLGTGVYNKQITEDPKVFPYLLYTRTCRNVPLFIWQPYVSTVKFDHQVMERHEKNETEKIYLDKRTWKGFIKDLRNDSVILSGFFFGYPLAIPSLAFLLLFFFHHRTMVRFWTALVVLLIACSVMTCYATPHYFSPLTCLVVLSVTVGLRGLAGLKLLKMRVGSASVILLITLQLALNIILTPALPIVRSLARAIQSPPTGLPASFTREGLKAALMKRTGKYLVIVRYPPWHNYLLEWVYNGADIDHAPVVWARDMGQQNDKKLLEYFNDRQALFIYVYWDMRGFPHFWARS